ncbi:SHOCT domain-containing protein [Arthrobacter castelli]|uniref:SHOCT domain-containing protein n=1 Tax=Arthrobacter castelli TaxID=271431 RepID=UPI0003FD7427|nr:SHOCT domain-containing protein [Arthrobacter castelli]
MGGMMGGAMIWAVLVLLLLAAGAVAVIVLAIRAGRQGTPRPGGTSGSDEAHNDLRRRYAAGEIDDEEYQHRREALGSD